MQREEAAFVNLPVRIIKSWTHLLMMCHHLNFVDMYFLELLGRCCFFFTSNNFLAKSQNLFLDYSLKYHFALDYICTKSPRPNNSTRGTIFWPGPNTARPATHSAQAGPARYSVPCLGCRHETAGSQARHDFWSLA